MFERVDSVAVRALYYLGWLIKQAAVRTTRPLRRRTEAARSLSAEASRLDRGPNVINHCEI